MNITPSFMQMPKMQRKLFGQDFQFPVNSRNGDKHDVVSVLADITCVTPTVLGVQISSIINPSGTAFGIGSIPGLRAELIWGVDGGNFTAVIDAMQGMSLNLVAQTLRVTLIDESIYAGGGTSSLAVPFIGTASCVFGGVPKTQPTIRTVRPSPVGATVTIPKFARKLNVIRFDTTLGTSNYTLLFQDANTQTVGNLSVPAGGELQSFVLPGRATAIVPTLGVGVTELSYIFELDLG